MRALALLLVMLCLAGCVTPSREAGPAPAPSNAAPIGFEAVVRTNSYDRRVTQHMAETLARLRRGADGSLDILALSGGGAGGAYGAGVLVGLTRAGTRPQFEIVTGVSTGAMIAPFAFLGSDWDEELEEAYTGPMTENLLRRRGLSLFLRPGIYFGDPLRRLADHFVSIQLIGAVAAECGRGRLLLIQTTNLDTQDAIIWNMCEIVQNVGEPAREMFRDVLIASASVPGVFPPVMLNVMSPEGPAQEMHVDGGVTGSFFVMPQIISQWNEGSVSELHGGHIYVILNGQLDNRLVATPLNTLPIVARSFETNQMFQARAAIAITSEFAARNHLEFRFTRIPREYPFKGPLDFDGAAMRALFSFGVAQGEGGQLWTTPERYIDQIAQPVQGRQREEDQPMR